MPTHTATQDRRRGSDAGRQRQAARSEQMRRRVAEAKSPEAALNQAFDWMRGSAKRMSKHATRTGEHPDRPAAERIMRDVTAYLARVAADIDTRGSDRG